MKTGLDVIPAHGPVTNYFRLLGEGLLVVLPFDDRSAEDTGRAYALARELGVSHDKRYATRAGATPARIVLWKRTEAFGAWSELLRVGEFSHTDWAAAS